jgi:hypothetical protein
VVRSVRVAPGVREVVFAPRAAPMCALSRS